MEAGLIYVVMLVKSYIVVVLYPKVCALAHVLACTHISMPFSTVLHDADSLTATVGNSLIFLICMLFIALFIAAIPPYIWCIHESCVTSKWLHGLP